MARRKQNVELKVAVCADSKEDQAILKTYVETRGWEDAGYVYRCEQWPELLTDAKDRKFNAVCATVGGLRWLAQVAPETDFRPKPKRRSEPVTPASDEKHQSIIIERARAMTVEKPQSAEAIAQSLIADSLITGTQAGAARCIRQALMRSGEFSASEPGDGQPMLWRPWARTVSSVDQPDGSRIIHTEVLSTTGIPVHITIPVKSSREIAQMLLQEVMAERPWIKGGKAAPDQNK